MGRNIQALRDNQARQRVNMTDLEGMAMQAVVSPLPTVVEAVRDVVGTRDPAVLTSWQRRALRGVLSHRAVRALSVFRPTQMPSDGAPNPLLEAHPGASIEDEFERVASTDPDALGLAIERATKAGRPTAPWLVAHREPRGWLEDYLEAVRLVWAEVRPLWTGARDRLEREAERIRVAAHAGALAQVVADPTMPGQPDKNDLVLPSHTESSGRLHASGTLQLVPLLAGPGASSWGDDYGDGLLSLRYGLPAIHGTGETAPAHPESLEALLGPSRASLLLALEYPQNPGDLANALFLTPSGISHHLAALEAAQLITRTRENRHVTVKRTVRATTLLALYDRA